MFLFTTFICNVCSKFCYIILYNKLWAFCCGLFDILRLTFWSTTCRLTRSYLWLIYSYLHRVIRLYFCHGNVSNYSRMFFQNVDSYAYDPIYRTNMFWRITTTCYRFLFTLLYQINQIIFCMRMLIETVSLLHLILIHWRCGREESVGSIPSFNN